jgi:Cu/Ag efflux protein CusF
MKRTTLAAVAFALGFAPLCHAQSKGGAVAVEQTDAVVTVTKVDMKARTVSFRGPRGDIATLMVPAEAQNLDQVKPGQQFRMKYVESVAVEIQKGGKASASATQEMNLAPKGAKPGGVMVRTQQIAGVVDAIDYGNRYVAVRGPKGNVLAFKVADDVKLDQIAAGDRIVLTHTEALAIEMVAQAPAKPKK